MPHSGAHDPSLVVLSVLIAIAASYTALDLAGRMRQTSGWPSYVWLATAALAMGGGIWSMHFVAMLAFSIPGVSVRGYSVGLTLLSLALPIAVTAIGFHTAIRGERRIPMLLASGLVMGLGIAGMHYLGMAALRVQAQIHYDRLWVLISIVIAMVAATVALWLSFRSARFVERLFAAAAMGLAVSGMHYAAMRGMSFTPAEAMAHEHAAVDVNPVSLALWVTGTTFLILILALVAAMFDRHFAQLAEREASALRQSEERFRLLVQSVTDYAIFMLDETGRVANWNAGAQRIKGYTFDEIVGSHFSRFYTEEDKAAGVPRRALDTAATEGKFESEGWRVRKDGTRFWASIVIDPIRDEKGQLVGFAKVTRDITERKQAQDALEQAREALAQSQKMEAVGQLTGGVAHDFNNLLMAVLGSLDLLRKRLPPDPKITRLLDNAIQGAERGAALTQRMLAFARRQDLKPSSVDLPDLVNGMSDLLNRSIGPTTRIETRFPLGLPPALVDANQLELALLNLVVNARDAMAEGGLITIGGREEIADGSGRLAAGRYVCLSVMDTGHGMDEATLARAQEPFFTTKGVGKGTGLGLSMVHGMAEQSQGRLVLTSRPDVGTTAEIWLPVAPPAEKAESTTSIVPYPRQASCAYTILVVDDDPLVLENTAAMLEDLGHRVIEARSGAEALELLNRARTLDLVITDHVMPEMTGLQLIERLRKERPGLRLMLATGYAELPTETQASLPRLNKPFDQNALAWAIDDIMREPGSGVLPFRPKHG
ncbi:sensor histidine kinase [Alsobacter soli]|uniref:histidine kinase n=1 Tax=Alsobacter soli TaxID=2109933 RepID=A0A2T1HUC7_9HYPH|nr:MHYT domain-containing protein [Alsobacter soli]PSC05129.1 sensor histidine kinase [Alsobacter soli]